MTVLNQAKLQSYNVYAAKNSFSSKTVNISGSSNAKNAKQIPEQADISHIKTTQNRILDTYTLSTRVMSYEEFYELMTSDKSSEEKHAALVEKYGNVLSFCAYEKGMQAIQNGTFSLEEFHVNMEVRHESSKTSMADMIKAFEAADPNKAEMERDAERAKRFVPIQNKMFAGKPLSAEEKAFLQEHYPQFYAKAVQIEQEVAQLKAKLKAAKSKEEASQIYLDTKMRLIGDGKDPASVFFTGPAIDAAYQSMK